MTISQRQADPSHTSFSPIDDASRSASSPVAIETRDHGIIRSWAECHGVAPAARSLQREGDGPGMTGELRFMTEFPSGEGALAWTDWFATFDALGLCFVFEAEISARSLASSQPALRTGANVGTEGSVSRLHVEAASTGRFRLKRARVGELSREARPSTARRES